MATLSVKAAGDALATALPQCVKDLALTVMSVGDGQACLAMSPMAAGLREGGSVSGQALASLADTAMLLAVWSSLGAATPVATIDLHVSFLRAAGPGDVLAQADVVRRGRTLAFARVSMASAAAPAQPVATGIATFSLPA